MRRVEWRRPGAWARRRSALCWAGLVSLALANGVALAHGETDDTLPSEAGLRLQAAAALRSLDTRRALPSTRLDGVLLRGDAGRDPQGTQLEHGSLSAAWRWHPQWGAHAALSAHGSEPVQVEAAWLQWRRDADSPPGASGGQRLSTQTWLLTAGRQSPALGPVLQPEGHIGRFALVPLAQRAALDHPAGDDGLQAGWRGRAGLADAWQFSLDGGLWRGRAFPGAPQGGSRSPGLSLHAGAQGAGFSADLALLQFQPRARGANTSAGLGHSHRAPVCDPGLTEVICFDGRAQLLGGSLRWTGADSAMRWPISLSLAGWWRRDQGQLESADGLAVYRGRTQGGWLDLSWQAHEAWTLAWRHEWLQARHHLQGAGAGTLALQARLQHARPLRRDSLHAVWQAAGGVALSVEAGQERDGAARTPFAALRLVLRGAWERPTP